MGNPKVNVQRQCVNSESDTALEGITDSLTLNVNFWLFPTSSQDFTSLLKIVNFFNTKKLSIPKLVYTSEPKIGALF